MRSNRTGRSLLSLLLIGGITAVAPLLGRRAAKPGLWYRLLRKPAYNPPAWVFAPVWTTLYALSAASVWRVWRAPPSAERSRALALWGVQHALNAAWTPLFFGARRARAALVDVVALAAVAGAYASAARRVDPAATKLIAPYVGWVGFAATLNGGIVAKNPALVAG